MLVNGWGRRACKKLGVAQESESSTDLFTDWKRLKGTGSFSGSCYEFSEAEEGGKAGDLFGWRRKNKVRSSC